MVSMRILVPTLSIEKQLHIIVIINLISSHLKWRLDLCFCMNLEKTFVHFMFLLHANYSQPLFMLFVRWYLTVAINSARFTLAICV